MDSTGREVTTGCGLDVGDSPRPRSVTARNKGRWLASAPAVYSPRSGQYEPIGRLHARIDSDPLTACGRLAVTWRVYWTDQFNAVHPSSCRECAEVVNRG